MNQEEENIDSNKIVYRHFAETECKEENEDIVPISMLDEENTCHKTDEYFDEEYKKMEKEDAMIFKNQSWLEHCRKMEVDNNQTAEPVEIQQKLEVQEDEDDDIEVIYSNNSKKSTSLKRKANKIVLQNRNDALVSTHDKGEFQNEKVPTPIKNHSKYTPKSQEEAPSILDEAPVSETATTGLCHYTCSKCSVTYIDWAKFVLHMKKQHQSQIGRSQLEDYLSKVVVHICLVCSEKVLCDSGLLATHLRRHKMTITSYRKKYDCDEDWKVRNNNMLENGLLLSNEIGIGNMCSFVCTVCNKKYKSLRKLRRHFYTVKGHVQMYKSKHLYKYVKDTVTHRCKLCAKLLLCDNYIIQRHLLNHKIKSISEYAEKTGCTVIKCSKARDLLLEASTNKAKIIKKMAKLCRYECHACDHNGRSWNSMKKHLKSHGSSQNKEWYENIKKTVIYYCETCEQNVFSIHTH